MIKKCHKTGFLLCILMHLSIFNTVMAQNYNLKGIVTDTLSGEAIEFANVVLKSAGDSADYLSVLTDKNGAFSFEDLKPGTYHLKIAFLGYQSKMINEITIENSVDLGKINLNIQEEKIGDVTITSDKPLLSYKVDRKVINASNFPEAKVAMDLLENIPSVQVDINGKLSYRGDGNFLIFINGHQVLNGEEKLKQISTNRIERVEVITNPSAKYSSEGTAGIIQIILKKNRLEGYAINSGINFSSLPGFEYNFSIDKKGEKGGWYLSGQYVDAVNKKSEENEFKRIVNATNNEIFINKNSKFKGTQSYIEFGLNYNLSDKDYIDFSVNINPFRCINIEEYNGSIEERVYDSDQLVQNQDYSILATNNQSYNYIGSTISFEHSFNSDNSHSLTASLDYSGFLDDFVNKQLDTKTYTSTIEKIGHIGKEENEVLLEGKLDYSLPLNEISGIEMGMGMNLDYIPKSTSVSGTFDTEENIVPFSEEQINQSVNFKQEVYSAYFTFNSKWKKTEFLLGIRTEYTNQKSDYSYEDISSEFATLPYNSSFIDFFPSAHFIYNFSENTQLYINYSRRIERPDYWKLIPLKQYSSPYSYYKGNGSLLPEYSDSYETGFKKSWTRDFIALELFARRTNDVVQDYSMADTVNRIIAIPMNVGKSWSIGTEFMLGVDLFKWWNLNISTSLYSYRLLPDLAGINGNLNQFKSDSRINNKFLLPKSFKIKFDLLYNSPLVSVQYKRDGFFYSNISITKGFKENKWQLSFVYYNIFSTAKFDTNSEGEDFYIHSNTTVDPYFSLKLVYSFNNQK